MLRILMLCGALLAIPAFAQAPLPPVQGQLLHLPIYSHILYGDITSAGKPQELLLSAQISIRNADPASPIRVTSVQYYDGTGKRLKEFAPKPVVVPPLGAHEFYVPKSDSSGGTGASMLVRWQSDKPVNPPVVEAIHAEVAGTRALAFVTTGRPIADGK
jgi:hypothetical protein